MVAQHTEQTSFMTPSMLAVECTPKFARANIVMQHYEYARIMADMNNEIYTIERAAADRMLAYYKNVLSNFRLSRHRVTVWAVDPYCGLAVNGKPLTNTHWREHHKPAIDILLQVQQSLSFRLAYYLVGQSLT